MGVDEIRETIAAAEPMSRGSPKSTAREWPAPLEDAALHGVVGEFVRLTAPHTEGDPAAILVQFLVAFGSSIGRGPFVRREADQHGTNLFAVVVGNTAKARKGTSWGQARRPFELADESWGARVMPGLSSGEGLIWEVRDPIPAGTSARESRAAGPVAGVADKRLMVVEPEFGSVLRMLRRDGSTLSPVIRCAWDGGDLRVLTKNSPAVARGAHVSIIGHITVDELLRHLDGAEANSGFANRFLWICVKRSKLLPDGGLLEDAALTPIVKNLRRAREHSAKIGEVRMEDDAHSIWMSEYPVISKETPGLLGAVTARAEAQVIRLALVYALLDCSATIGARHLRAALAVWRYAAGSASFIFGARLGDAVADKILDALRDTPEGMTRTGIRDLFKRHCPAERVNDALNRLLAAGYARSVDEPTDGRPVERWFAVAV